MFVVAAVGVVALSGGGIASAQTDDSVNELPEPGPIRSEPFEARGAEAVAALETIGATDVVAANADMTADELIEELADDPAMFVTSDGMVGYAEMAPSNDAPLESGGVEHEQLTSSALVPSDVFALDSNPLSDLTIYLDFTGHTTVDDYWNSTFGRPSIVSPPYDVDGNTSNFSAVERANIYEVWQRVSEDYSPFDVNVTTRDPGVEGLRKTSSGDTAYGQRMVITSNNWYGPGTLGVALIAVFDANFDHTAFVFSSEVVGPSAKGVAETVSHESGHTFGLRHDGAGGSGYYDGHGDWAPIMGRPLSKTVTQWSKGEYAGATSSEDDINVIAAATGYQADDHGGGSANATAVCHSSTTTGRIGAGGDKDSFRVVAGAGTLDVTVQPMATWANLHAKVTVSDSTGAVVGSATPGAAVSWTSTVSTVATPGVYTIDVESTSWLTPSTGFSTYGSLGAYELRVTGVAPSEATLAGAGLATHTCTSLFTATTPTRLLDTRGGLGGSLRLGAGEQVVLQVAGTSGIPSNATAAVVNLTAVDPLDVGYLTAHPCVPDVPNISTVNFVGGQTVANNTIATLSAAGQICIWAYSEVDVLVDVTGWLGTEGGSRFTPTGPTRVVDTRSGLGGTRVPAGGEIEVSFTGKVPAGSSAVALNVTATGTSGWGFLTVAPCGVARPDTSAVNYLGGEDRPNNAIVGLGGGKVCIYSFADTDVLVDLVGSFGPSGLSYKPTQPVRLIDTRGGAPVAAGVSTAYSTYNTTLGGAAAEAAFVNVTAVDHPVPGFLTTFDCTTLPSTSTLNQQVGQATANGAIVPLASDDGSCVWMYGGGHLVIDLAGWWVQ